jgi:Holliday junction resolvasome RuvABC endonuclease subunit
MVTQLLRLTRAPEPVDASDGVAAALAHLMGMHLPRIVAEGRPAPRVRRA